MIRRSVVLAFALTLAAKPMPAQWLRPLIPAHAIQSGRISSTEARRLGFLGAAGRDYRYEGFFAGFAIGFGWSVWQVSKCDNRCAAEPTLLVVGTSALASFVGLLIGGAIPKSHR
jgi:hypothetical protein